MAAEIKWQLNTEETYSVTQSTRDVVKTKTKTKTKSLGKHLYQKSNGNILLPPEGVKATYIYIRNL